MTAKLRCFAGVREAQADRESAAEILSEVEGSLLSYRKLRCFAGVREAQADREFAAEILNEVEGSLLSYRRATRQGPGVFCFIWVGGDTSKLRRKPGAYICFQPGHCFHRGLTHKAISSVKAGPQQAQCLWGAGLQQPESLHDAGGQSWVSPPRHRGESLVHGCGICGRDSFYLRKTSESPTVLTP